MFALNTRTLVVLLAFALAPATLAAQQPTPQPQTVPQPSVEVQRWLAEAQQIQQRLEPIHTRALEEPTLRQAQLELNESILAALRDAGPAVQADLRRIETIQPELRAVQESGDQEQMQRLVREGVQLQQRLMQAQDRVLQQPEIATQAQAFQTRLQARMIEIDPDAEAMLQRLTALQAQILAAMQAQPQR